MFSNVGWGEIGILIIAALVILGPERLPGAIRGVAGTVKQVREYLAGATQQMKEEFGNDFDHLKEPLAQLNELRNLNPRSAVTQYLFHGDESVLDDLNVQKLAGMDDDFSAPSPQHLSSPPPVDSEAT